VQGRISASGAARQAEDVVAKRTENNSIGTVQGAQQADGVGTLVKGVVAMLRVPLHK
jgi:hypothetical protein